MCDIFATKKCIFLLIFWNTSGFKSINLNMYNFSKFFSILLTLIFLSGCGNGFFKRSDVKDTPVNVEDRVRKNIEEGRGVRFGLGKSRGGVFDFASANELWRASVETLDFVPLVNASYSGGIIITDWYSDDTSGRESLKITIRFLTNEIRSDALDVKIFKKDCGINQNCAMYEEDGDIIIEIKKSILKKAALYKKNKIKSKGKDLGSTGFSKN